MWKTHGKFFAALLGAVVMAAFVGYQAVAPDGVTWSEWVTVLIAVAMAANVWLTANLPSFSKAKTIVAVVFVVLNLLVSIVSDHHVSADEWTLLVINALAAAGVAGAPAVSALTSNPVNSPPARFKS